MVDHVPEAQDLLQEVGGHLATLVLRTAPGAPVHQAEIVALTRRKPVTDFCQPPVLGHFISPTLPAYKDAVKTAMSICAPLCAPLAGVRDP